MPLIRHPSLDDALRCTGKPTCIKLSFSQTPFGGGSNSKRGSTPKEKVLLVKQFLSLTNQSLEKGSNLKMVKLVPLEVHTFNLVDQYAAMFKVHLTHKSYPT